MTKFTTILAGSVALALGAGAVWAQEATMRLSHQFPPTHHSAVRLDKFAQDVAQETGGAVAVQLYGAAQLYKPNQHHAAVASGEIEAAAIVNLQWGGTIPEMAVTLIPYYVSAPAAQKAFIGSEASQFLDELMLTKGVRNIAWMVDTNDLIFTSAKAPLETPADFEGIKIRGLTPLFDEGLIAMGATPVAMPGSETYQALQTGVIDAGITGVAASYSRKFYEVQKFGRATPMFLAFDNIVVNPAWWDGLSDEARAGVERAAARMVEDSITSYEGINPQDIENLTGAGMDAAALSDDRIEALRDIMAPAVRSAFLEQTGENGQRLLDLIDGN